MPTLPLIPLRGMVLLPGALAPLLASPYTLTAAQRALTTGEPITFVAQLDPAIEDPMPQDLHRVGCIGRVLRSVRFPDGSARILVEGLKRARLDTPFRDADGLLRAMVREINEISSDPIKVQALSFLVREQLTHLLSEDLSLSPDLARAVPDGPPGRLADYTAGVLFSDPVELQALLEEPDPAQRLARVSEQAAVAIFKLSIANRLQESVQKAMDAGQREFYLKEQLKAIRSELGELDGLDDTERIRERIAAVGLPPLVQEEADRELDRLRRMNSDAAEHNVSRTWLDWLASLPWKVTTEDKNDLRHAKRILDQDHYGLTRVKDRILEYLAVRQLKPDARGMLLCFAGPPGVGKTSLGESIARALGRSFQRVALGGIHDESEIRGHRRTYIGALPGRIIHAMRRAGSRNPLLMLDEIDKLGKDFRGDPASALLEVLDPEQNKSFVDHYLDVPFDLSQVLFVGTANVVDTIPAALLDRMEIIELPGYIEEDKLEIASRHLMPKVLENHGLTRAQVRLNTDAIRELIRRYTREAGVRNLERELARIHRKAARKVVEGRTRPISISSERLKDYLGAPPYHIELAEQADIPGVAIGLAWTPVGGEILFVEATRFPEGKGQLKLTGSLGEVMKESVEAAFSLLRSGAGGLGLAPGEFSSFDYHLHLPSGAIPKDGPSAGVTMITALASLISGRRVRPELAMTGEITLRGKVLPVGGIKEKVLAARRAGVKAVVLPRHNQHDLEDVPSALLRDLTFHFVSEVGEVLKLSLITA